MKTLPVIDTPKFELVVPSTGKKVLFRPYLVKEEKILFIALESNNALAVIRAMEDVVRACTFGAIDTSKLTSYDLEYIFLQLRIKSVGETSTVNLKCEKDGELSPIDIDLTKIKVISPPNFKDTQTIKINDNIGLVLKPVTLERLYRFTQTEDSQISQLDLISFRLMSVIDSIYDGETIYSADSVSLDELKEFVDNLPRKVIEQIRDFMVSCPTMTHTVKFNCFKCGHTNTVELSGIQSFFG